MLPLAFGAVSALLVLLAALAVRMMRVSLVDDLVLETGPAAEAPERRPFTRLIDAIGSFTQRFLRSAYGDVRLERLRGTLQAAGNPDGLTDQVFIQREAGFITLGLLLLLVFLANGQPLLGAVLAVVFAGWMHVWLLVSARDRTARIERDLPDFLDVFAVTVAAGLPFRVAMQRVAEYHTGPLADELTIALREMQLGVPRRSALGRMRERSRSDNVATFVTALLQAEELGTPLASALQEISAEVRRQRAQQVRQAATKAQPKVSIVVTLTIVPGTIILVIGGILVMNLDVFKGLLGG